MGCHWLVSHTNLKFCLPRLWSLSMAKKRSLVSFALFLYRCSYCYCCFYCLFSLICICTHYPSERNWILLLEATIILPRNCIVSYCIVFLPFFFETNNAHYLNIIPLNEFRVMDELMMMMIVDVFWIKLLYREYYVWK